MAFCFRAFCSEDQFKPLSGRRRTYAHAFVCARAHGREECRETEQDSNLNRRAKENREREKKKREREREKPSKKKRDE